MECNLLPPSLPFFLVDQRFVPRRLRQPMNENSTGKMRDRTNLKKLDSLTDEEIEQAAQSDAGTLLLEECNMASLRVSKPQ